MEKFRGIFMKIFSTSERIALITKRGKLLIPAVVAIMLAGLFVGCQGPATKEPAGSGATAPRETGLSAQKLEQLVKGLGYPDATTQAFTAMALSWKDTHARPALTAWTKRLEQARESFKQGKTSSTQLAEAEHSVVTELGQKVLDEISHNDKLFDLGDVVKRKQANCTGYSQIVYLIGNFVGLSVQAMEATDLVTGAQTQRDAAHTAGIITLNNQQKIMVDLAAGSPMISKPFVLNKIFQKVGNYWELKDGDNSLNVHKRIQTLGKNGLIAAIYNNRANTYVLSGRPEQAISVLNQAIELAPKSAWSYHNRANIRNSQREPDRAVPDYNLAIEIDPQFSQAYNARAVAYTRLQRYSEAFSDFAEAVRLNPKLPKAYYNRARVYLRLNQPENAISDFNEVITLDPNHPRAYNYRGVAYFSLQQFERALSEFSQAAKLDPNYAEAHFNRGNAYLKLGQSRSAVDAYAAAIRLNPKWSHAYFRRGFTYYRLGSYDEAVQDFSETIKLNPSYAPAYYRRAIAYSKLTRPEDALADLTQAITLDPNYANAYISRASTNAFLKKLEEAKQDLLKAVELKPALRQPAQRISDQFELGLQFDESPGPSTKE
jgi:tetratricopeptide (TPR) repeat protein